MSIHGGAITVSDPDDLEVVLNQFEGNTSTAYGGALYLTGSGNLNIAANRICGGSAGQGGAVALTGNGSLKGTLQHNVVSDTVSANEGGSFRIQNAELTVAQNTLVGAQSNPGAISIDASSRVDLYNNILVGHTGSALVIDQADAASVGWNLYWSNDQDLAADAQEEGRLVADPEFEDLAEAGCEQTFRVAITSPAVDAGDPEILDWDGTRSDIGAYGGPNAATYYDLDGGNGIDKDP